MLTDGLTAHDTLPSSPPLRVVIDGDPFDWVPIDFGVDQGDCWAHPGAATGPNGSIYVTAPHGQAIVVLAQGGGRRTIAVDATQVHGIAIAESGNLWIADNGQRARSAQGAMTHVKGAGAVHSLACDGTLLATLLAPPGLPWAPCSVALSDFGRGAGGAVFVADGYGCNVVHRFSRDGELMWSCDGSASGRRFVTPHAVIVDDRANEPRLLVADRGNFRIVALSLDGDFLCEFGREDLTSPSGFALRGDQLWVTELWGSIRVFGPDDVCIAQFGEPLRERTQGWPNALVGDDFVAPIVPAGVFRSPHGIAVASDGSVIVAEWLLGGRVTLLRSAGLTTDAIGGGPGVVADRYR